MNSVSTYNRKYKLITEKYKFRKHFHTPSLLDELVVKKQKERYNPRSSCELKPINNGIFQQKQYERKTNDHFLQLLLKRNELKTERKKQRTEQQKRKTCTQFYRRMKLGKKEGSKINGNKTSTTGFYEHKLSQWDLYQ